MTTDPHRCCWLLLQAVLLALLPATGIAAEAAAEAPGFDHLATSPYVHCAFYRDYEIDGRTGDRLLVEGRSNSLTHYQRQRDGRVRSVDTRRAGAGEARLVQGRYLHYIERSGAMFVVTTIYACLARDPQSDRCINYGAVNARHFDARVLREPDQVYEELQAQAEPGFCDHSFIHLREAAAVPSGR